jgi:hypothetical protein
MFQQQQAGPAQKNQMLRHPEDHLGYPNIDMLGHLLDQVHRDMALDTPCHF